MLSLFPPLKTCCLWPILLSNHRYLLECIQIVVLRFFWWLHLFLLPPLVMLDVFNVLCSAFLEDICCILGTSWRCRGRVSWKTLWVGRGGVAGSVLLVETLPILTCNIMILDWKPPSRACFAAVLGSIMVDRSWLSVMYVFHFLFSFVKSACPGLTRRELIVVLKSTAIWKKKRVNV